VNKWVGTIGEWKRGRNNEGKVSLTFPAASNVPINVAITAHEAIPTGKDRAGVRRPRVERGQGEGKVVLVSLKLDTPVNM
jgi:hypothetical protein